jgi:hypothetical protein
VGVFAVDRTARNLEGLAARSAGAAHAGGGGGDHGHARAAGLALATPVLRRVGLNPIPAFVGRFYSQERLAGAAPPSA